MQHEGSPYRQLASCQLAELSKRSKLPHRLSCAAPRPVTSWHDSLRQGCRSRLTRCSSAVLPFLLSTRTGAPPTSPFDLSPALPVPDSCIPDELVLQGGAQVVGRGKGWVQVLETAQQGKKGVMSMMSCRLAMYWGQAALPG